MSLPAVELIGVSYGYPDATPALRGVELRIAAGEAVAVVGANGAGKSTLLLHLNGLLLPSAGEVRICGLTVTHKTLAEVRRRVGFVFQDADDQLFMPTVHDDVAFGPLNQGLPANEVQARVQAALEAVDAAHLAGRAPYRLSGGEKRAAAIAGVLAMQPSILVLDEPSSGLDPAGRRRLIDLLRSFKQTRVIATHDLDLALEVCQRVLVMHEGEVLADGTPAELFCDHDLLRRCQLEPPRSAGRAGTFAAMDALDYAELAQTLVASRQNVSPRRLIEPGPDAVQLDRIFAAAAAAPDHGEITPWRFVIVPADERARLGEVVFARALIDRDPNATHDQIDEARRKAQRGPLLMLAIARLGAADRDIPAVERLLSLGCAVQNMQLVAHAMGLGCGLTGGQALASPRMRELFELADGEVPVCWINFGTVVGNRTGRQRPAPGQFVSSL